MRVVVRRTAAASPERGARPSRRARSLRAVLSALALATLGGCTGSTTGPAPESTPSPTPDPSATAAALASGVVLDAVLDRESASIRYPVDAFLPTRHESEVLGTAVQLEVAACAAEQGLHYLVPVRETPAEYDQRTLDGPWTVAQAERFAFVEPMTDADLRANEIVGAPAESTTSDEERGPTLGDVPLDDPLRQVVTDCARTTPVVDEFAAAQSPGGSWSDAKSDAVEEVQHAPEADALRDELRACYEREGIAVDTAAFASGILGQTAGVAGADPARIDAEQVALALASVGCKDEVGYTERAASLIAEAQASVVVTYLAELRTAADTLAGAVAEAERIVVARADLTTSW